MEKSYLLPFRISDRIVINDSATELLQFSKQLAAKRWRGSCSGFSEKMVSFISIQLLILLSCFKLTAQNVDLGWTRTPSTAVNIEKEEKWSAAATPPSIRWPWGRQGYFSWWADQVGLRIVQQASVRPGVRFLHQASELQYSADEAVIGGELVIDSDLLNAVNLPSVIENKLRDLSIQLPTGILTRESQSWTSLAQLEIKAVGLTVRGSYWSGALAPARFPQPTGYWERCLTRRSWWMWLSGKLQPRRI